MSEISVSCCQLRCGLAHDALPLDALRSSVFVDSDDQIRSPIYQRNVAIGFLSTGMSRRRFVDWAHDQLVNCDQTLRWPDGRPYEMSDTPIDDVFWDDGSFRWLSELAKRAREPIKRQTQERLIERYRRLGLALKLGGGPWERVFGAPPLTLRMI